MIRPLADVLEPVMILLNAIPRVILAPLFIIWFGIDIGSKVALSLVLVAVLVFFSVYSGIREVDTAPRRARADARRRARHAAARGLHALGHRLGDGQPQGRGRLRLHRRGGRRVRRLEPRPRLPAVLRAEHLQRRADAGADLHHHGLRAPAVHAGRPPRAPAAALALRLTDGRGRTTCRRQTTAALAAELSALLRLAVPPIGIAFRDETETPGVAPVGAAAPGADRGRPDRRRRRAVRLLVPRDRPGLLHRRGRPRQLQRRQLHPRLQAARRGRRQGRRRGAGAVGLGRRGRLPARPGGEGQARARSSTGRSTRCRWRRTSSSCG